DDLDIQNGHGLALMSDQHKGLIEALKEVMPLAEHRQCARHIYEEFQKSYTRVEFRGLFWAASKASYPQMFNRIMDKIKRSNPDSHQYLLKKDPKTWSRAFFQEGSNCKAVENGVSECFNAVLLSVRHKPIITLLESMRIIEQTKDQQRFWHVIPSGGNKFEVRRGSDAFKVDEKAKTCSCKMWQLSGLPCAHAIACIFKLNKMVEDYVPECFRKDMYIKAYSQYLKPMDGITFWPDCSHMSRVLGPIPKKMPGRPRKKRIRAPHENKSTYKISRAGVEMTCLNCGEKGHNKKGCKNEPIPQTPKVPCKTGRPKKKVPIDTTSLVNEDDIPRFVNTEIDEYDRAASSNNVVFNNGRRIELGMNWNKNKCGKYVGNSYVKVRGGKTKKGGLIPAVRFGRIEKCLDVHSSLKLWELMEKAHQMEHEELKYQELEGQNLLEEEEGRQEVA
ncbi:pentatricopeptide repeat-containing protein, partial [Tanacetum coccineum]